MIQRNLKAKAVLAVLEDIAADSEVSQHWTVEEYANGREHGFTVSSASGSVAFSENRNSDQIVVYPIVQANMWARAWDNSTGLDKGAYESARYFNCYDYHRAARFIVGILNGKSVKEAQESLREIP